MSDEIINCYELEIKQDIPAEMELLKSNSDNLKNSNRNFKILLLSISIGAVLWVILQNSKSRKDEKDKY